MPEDQSTAVAPANGMLEKQTQLEQHLTDELARELSEQTAVARLAMMTQTTPEEFIKTRPGAGRKQYRYIPHASVVRMLNHAFNFKWNFEVLRSHLYTIGVTTEETGEYSEKPFEMEVEGRLTVTLDSGEKIIKEQIGSKTIEFKTNKTNEPVSLADAKKAAASDSLKKCSTLLGFGIDLLDGGDVTFDDSDEQPPPAAATTPDDVVKQAGRMKLTKSTLRVLIAHAFNQAIGLFDELDDATAESTVKLLRAITKIAPRYVSDVKYEAFLEYCIENNLELTSSKHVHDASKAYAASLKA